MPPSLTLTPTGDPHVFAAPDGRRLTPPADWSCLPPGDAGLTRRVKAAGPSWQVVEKRGRKTFSRGLWAPAANIESARAAIDAERSTDAYAKKRAADTARRERGHAAYAMSFEAEVHAFLAFAAPWDGLARSVAQLVAAHATPVGSGTVARTERIPIDERAEAAVIAWMRHQTTQYDDMRIERVAGRRREVRRELAQLSRAVLDLHRRPAPHAPYACTLCGAVARAAKVAAPAAPSSAAPSNVAPSSAAPSNAAPSNAAPSNATPSNATPSRAAPSNAAPSNAAPSSADYDDAYLDALDL